jgi:hypothetical protein
MLNTISFEKALGEDFPVIELLVDDQRVSDLLGPPYSGIPFAYFVGPDLPSGTDDGRIREPDDGWRMVAVCSCGDAGCGSCFAQVLWTASTVEMILPHSKRVETSMVRDDYRFSFPRDPFENLLRELWAYVQRGGPEDLRPKIWP